MKKTIIILIAILSLVAAHTASAGGAWVQTKETSVNGGTSLTTNVSSTAAGDLIIVFILNTGANNTSTTAVPTDNLGDTYTLAATSTTGANFPNGTIFKYYLANAPSGITAVSTTFAFSAMFMDISEYSGMATANPYDGGSFTSNGFNASGPWTSGAISTSNANDLIYGVATDVRGSTELSAGTAGATFTMRLASADTNIIDKFVAATGNYAATGTYTGISGQILADASAWKVASGGGSTSTVPYSPPPQVITMDW